MDFLFITAPRNCLFSFIKVSSYLQKKKKRRKGVAFIDNKKVWNVELGHSLKIDRMISVHFQRKPFKSMPPITNAKGVEVKWFYEDLQDCLEWISKRYVFFIIGIGMQK